MGLTITPDTVAVQDEGSDQGNVKTFNFVGSGVTAAVSGSVATVTVSGGGTVDYTQVLFVQVFS